MNTLVIFIALALSAAIANAQGIIELKEAKVVATPLYEMSANGNNFTVNVKENHAGEFELNPVAFLEKNFDINDFIAYTRNYQYDSYRVSFVSRKGKLEAEYDKEGDLVKSYFKFKDVLLPYALIQQTFLDNKGWSLVKNTFVGREVPGKSKEIYYLLTMENGTDKRRIKIDVSSETGTAIADLD